MKRKDLTTIITVAVTSGVFALIISVLLISPSKNRHQKVEVIQPITAEFQKPDTKYFNAQSIDPTKLIEIGNGSNTQPFR
jgi:hypothetical protein